MDKMHYSYQLTTCFKCFTLVLQYLGEGKKFHVGNKTCEKKIHFCLVWGFSND